MIYLEDREPEIGERGWWIPRTCEDYQAEAQFIGSFTAWVCDARSLDRPDMRAAYKCYTVTEHRPLDLVRLRAASLAAFALEEHAHEAYCPKG